LLKAGLLSEMRLTQPSRNPSIPDTAVFAIYTLALGLSISVWFLAIRAPLWLDETISLFIVKHGFSQILSRQGWPGVPAYPYILCLWIKVVGTGEIALRSSSIAAMLGAAYLLYRAARELFVRDVAIIAAIVFCLHPVVVAEAMDIRPYAFAALAINASIFVLVRLRHSGSVWLAALFAFLAVSIVYFQFLFAVALPPLALCFFSRKINDRKAYWRQICVALVVFVIAFLLVIPGMRYMFHSSGVHVFDVAPTFADLARALGQKRQLIVLAAVGLLAAATRRLDIRKPFARWPVLLCLSLALLPILLLWGVSTATSIHIFVARYRLVAVPGIALCWALAMSRIDSRSLRALFCIVFVAMSAYIYYRSPTARQHDYSWKYALEFAQKNASHDNAPVVICSDLPESDHSAMPTGAAIKDSALFAPLTYYPLSVPVVPLPRALNDEAKRLGAQFLREAAQRHQRFLAVAYEASYETIDWLQDTASETYDVRELGIFDKVEVVEFIPEKK
jgi:Dolichyl-phosphate-mannose-protein mannosyltransferase